MQLALQQLHAMLLFALFAARSLSSLCALFVQSRFPWSAMIRHFRKLAARQLQLALFFFFSSFSFASRSAQRWRCTFARLDETLKRSWTRCSLPGHGHGMAWHLSHWAFRWNVEMKWYALIKNELTQHAANAAADAADVSRCSSRGRWEGEGGFILFHFIVLFSLFFSLVFSFVPCAPL